MQSPQTPGVYYERVDASAPAIVALRTDIAGFVGVATRGPLNRALPVQSWRQFSAHFGDFTGSGYLAYAVRGFFENGGQRCWVVRVGSELTATAEMTVDVAGEMVWHIAASSPGVWGNDLDIALRETHRAQTLSRPSASTPEASAVQSITGFGRGTHVRLSQDGAKPIYKVVSDVDAVTGRLIWLHSEPRARLPYDSVLSVFDNDRPILIQSVEYTVWVRELGRLTRVYEGLSLVPEHPRYGPKVLAELTLQSSSQLFTLPASPEPVVIKREKDFNSEKWKSLKLLPLTIPAKPQIPLVGGADGLALLQASDFIGEDVDPLDIDDIKDLKTLGLKALEGISEISIVTIPDIHIQPIALPRRSQPPPCIPDPCLPPGPPAPAIPRAPAVGDLPPVFSEADIYSVQSALIQHCEKLKDRIAVLDPPYSAARDDRLGVGAVRAWRTRFDSKYAAFYYPWLRVVDPLRSRGSITRDIPPSGHVAGQYAQNDFQFGVHKAPANSPLVWTQDVTVNVDDSVHGVLNPVGINAIRPLAGRGIRIFGARTVSSDSDWRFVNVRRLLMMIEKAIDVATQWAVFEPNDYQTRAKIRLSLSSFLISLWERGALMGATTEQAFFVKCDEENNPPSERDLGHMLAEVGVAPSRPFEFIILRVGRAHNQFEITEAPASAIGSGVF